MRYCDLFCGLGAFHESFKKNYPMSTCVFASDIDPNVRKIYEMNHGLAPHGDITKIDPHDIPDFDVLCAGFPCQPFSIAGKKEGFSDQGRGNLFFTILDIIDAKNPHTLILENVKNLLTIENGNAYTLIQRSLEDRGYHVTSQVLNSKDYGSPQARQRLFILGSKRFPLEFKEPDYPLVNVRSILDATSTVKPWVPKEHHYLKRQGEHLKYMIMNRNTNKGGSQGQRIYSPDFPGITVCSSSGGCGANTGLYEVSDGVYRRLSIIETFRMFGFKDDYKHPPKCKIYFYLGNSIVVNVVDHIIQNIPWDIIMYA